MKPLHETDASALQQVLGTPEAYAAFHRVMDELRVLASILGSPNEYAPHLLGRIMKQWEEQARANAYAPCLACGRRVKSPCNDQRGFHRDGPWDALCHGHFYQSSFQ